MIKIIPLKLKYQLFFLTLIALLFQNCQKDIITKKNETSSINIQEAKEYFNTVIKSRSSLKSSNKIEASEANINLSLDIDWETALTKDQTVRVRLNYQKGLWYNIESSKDRIAFSDATYLLFYKDKSGGIHVEKVITIPKEGYYKTHTKGKLFTGILLFEDLNGNAKRIFQFDDGKYQRLDNNSLKSKNSNSTITNSTSNLNCRYVGGWTVCVGNYCNTNPGTLVCTGSAGGNPGEERDWGMPGTRDPHVPIDQEQQDPPEEPGNYPDEQVPDIKVEVSDPCLGKVIESTLNNDIIGKIKEVIGKFTNGPQFNLFFTNVPTIRNNADANATAVIKGDGIRVTVDVTIAFNDSNLENASKEYISGLILHEAIHAYLRALTGKQEPLDNPDHNIIAESYIEPISQYLHQTYGISEIDASSIAWRGVMATDAYQKANFFDVKVGDNIVKVSKQDMQNKGIDYLLSSLGDPKCK